MLNISRAAPGTGLCCNPRVVVHVKTCCGFTLIFHRHFFSSKTPPVWQSGEVFFPLRRGKNEVQLKACWSLKCVCSAKRRIFGSCAAISYSWTLNSFTFDVCNPAERQNKPSAKNWVLSVQRKNIFFGFIYFNHSAANSKIFNKQFCCSFKKKKKKVWYQIKIVLCDSCLREPVLAAEYIASNLLPY